MKPICISLLVVLLALPNFSFKTPTELITSSILEDGNSVNLSAFEVRQRLNQLDGMVDLKYTTDVEKNIKYYLGRRKKRLAKLIGKSEMYFPMFEHYLHVNNLPDELKYLSIVESALNPKAKSPVGASGLWQFMKGTGLKYGLKVDSYIDERNDPIKSTEAAFTYLNYLYEKYNDWTLALAAYNCGPGRINRAIKRGRTMDYWKLRKYLPAETRNYVPAFIAVTYVMNYYDSHGVQPTPAAFKFQELKTATIFEASSFYEISRLSNVDFSIIEKLNPAYKKQFIPQSTYGNYLTLPVAGMMNFKNNKRQAKLNGFYRSRNADYNKYMNIPADMVQSNYMVQKGEQLDYIARLLKCNKEDLIRWNKLRSPSVFNGQELVVYFPKQKMSSKVESVVQQEGQVSSKRVLYHYIKEGETLEEINSYYPDVTLSELIVKNKLFGRVVLEPGSKLKIKEM